MALVGTGHHFHFHAFDGISRKTRLTWLRNAAALTCLAALIATMWVGGNLSALMHTPILDGVFRWRRWFCWRAAAWRSACSASSPRGSSSSAWNSSIRWRPPEQADIRIRGRRLRPPFLFARAVVVARDPAPAGGVPIVPVAGRVLRRRR